MANKLKFGDVLRMRNDWYGVKSTPGLLGIRLVVLFSAPNGVEKAIILCTFGKWGPAGASTNFNPDAFEVDPDWGND